MGLTTHDALSPISSLSAPVGNDGDAEEEDAIKAAWRRERGEGFELGDEEERRIAGGRAGNALRFPTGSSLHGDEEKKGTAEIGEGQSSFIVRSMDKSDVYFALDWLATSGGRQATGTNGGGSASQQSHGGQESTVDNKDADAASE